mmetsp:Transcript_5466/g.14047  ORF Transcript_5466/g.14047 Transcript_5466/m.14047 type:complete len:124 (+) Transcript_5466:1-372(+)
MASDDWHLVAAEDALAKDGARIHVAVEARHITLVRVGSRLYAVDSVCYHAGGPLGAGNIEDIVVDDETLTCIRCPWHHYLISLIDGEKWYKSLERDDTGRSLVMRPSTRAAGKLVPAGFCLGV